MHRTLSNGVIEAELHEHGTNRDLFGDADTKRRRLRESANKIVPKLARSERRTLSRLLEMELHNNDDDDLALADDSADSDDERPAYHHRAADAIRAVVMDDSMDTAAKLKRIKILLGIMDDGQEEDEADAADDGDAERETTESRQFSVESGLAWICGSGPNPMPGATRLRESRPKPSGGFPTDIEDRIRFLRA